MIYMYTIYIHINFLCLYVKLSNTILFKKYFLKNQLYSTLLKNLLKTALTKRIKTISDLISSKTTKTQPKVE